MIKIDPTFHKRHRKWALKRARFNYHYINTLIKKNAKLQVEKDKLKLELRRLQQYTL